jgi:hypothetical protein
MRKVCPDNGLFISRRRKCGNGHLSYTEEKFVGAPAKAKGSQAAPSAVFSSVRGVEGIKLTEQSPEWLKKIAEKVYMDK